MTHTFSVCTPSFLPAGLCYNYDFNESYVTMHINLGSFNYSYKPSSNPCVTTSTSNMIKTVCPDSTTTMILQNMTPFNINDVKNRLDNIDKLINDTKINTHQCLNKMETITGVSCGDDYHNPKMNDFFGIKITQPDEKISISFGGTTFSDTSITCGTCGCVFDKKWLIDNELFWCQMCSTQHIFTPFLTKYFAKEDQERLDDKIQKQHHDLCTNNRSYWVNL